MLRRRLLPLALLFALFGLLLPACSSGGKKKGEEQKTEAEGEHHDDMHDDMHDDDMHDDEDDDDGEVSLEKTDPSKDYPMTTCVVSGEALDSMGGPIAFHYKGKEVQFCCSGCIKKFKADPDKYMSRVEAAGKE